MSRKPWRLRDTVALVLILAFFALTIAAVWSARHPALYPY